jgi:hypothetical protein
VVTFRGLLRGVAPCYGQWALRWQKGRTGAKDKAAAVVSASRSAGRRRPFANVGVNPGSLQRLCGDQPVESIDKPILGAIEARAANFYAKMPKLEPPQGGSILGAAQKPQERPSNSPSQSPTRPFRAMWDALKGSPR